LKVRRRKKLKSPLLLKAIAPDVLADLLRLEHKAQIKAAINSKLFAQSKARIGLLYGALTNMKKCDLTANMYITKMKGFALELAYVGQRIHDCRTRHTNPSTSLMMCI
jgi:hypothetical protein